MPSGKMQKIISTVLNVFMICSIITAFNSKLKNFKFKIDNFKSNSVTERGSKFLYDINSQIEETVKYNVETIIFNELRDKNILIEKVEIILNENIMDTNQNESISISKCKIYINKNQYKYSGDEISNRIKNHIEDTFKIETEVFIT